MIYSIALYHIISLTATPRARIFEKFTVLNCSLAYNTNVGEGQDPPLQWGTIFILRLENVENMMYNICYEKIAVKEAYGAYGK
jgi:hypothetical protein